MTSNINIGLRNRNYPNGEPYSRFPDRTPSVNFEQLGYQDERYFQSRLPLMTMKDPRPLVKESTNSLRDRRPPALRFGQALTKDQHSGMLERREGLNFTESSYVVDVPMAERYETQTERLAKLNTYPDGVRKQKAPPDKRHERSQIMGNYEHKLKRADFARKELGDERLAEEYTLEANRYLMSHDPQLYTAIINDRKQHSQVKGKHGPVIPPSEEKEEEKKEKEENLDIPPTLRQTTRQERPQPFNKDEVDFLMGRAIGRGLLSDAQLEQTGDLLRYGGFPLPFDEIPEDLVLPYMMAVSPNLTNKVRTDYLSQLGKKRVTPEMFKQYKAFVLGQSPDTRLKLEDYNFTFNVFWDETVKPKNSDKVANLITKLNDDLQFGKELKYGRLQTIFKNY